MDTRAVSGFRFPADRARDLICLGRAGVDMYAQQEGVALQDVTSFRKSVGGSPANIATGAARLGLRAGLIGVVSADGFGSYVRQFLIDNQVDVQCLKTDTTGALNSVAFTEVRPDNCKVIIFRRDAADLHLMADDIDRDYLASAAALLVTGTALSASPSREACLHAMQLARQAGTVVVLDMDYRPYGWASTTDAAMYLRMACGLADIVIGNREEFDVLGALDPVPLRESSASAQQLIDRVGVQAVVVKDGANGCQIFLQNGTVITQGIFPVKARKPFGSGDAFAAALLWGLFQGKSWQDAARLGAAAAAINVSRDSCAEAMASTSELMAFMASYPPAPPTSPLNSFTESRP
jgi:5-dehydro-2-deoxygluconokinase